MWNVIKKICLTTTRWLMTAVEGGGDVRHCLRGCSPGQTLPCRCTWRYGRLSNSELLERYNPLVKNLTGLDRSCSHRRENSKCEQPSEMKPDELARHHHWRTSAFYDYVICLGAVSRTRPSKTTLTWAWLARGLHPSLCSQSLSVSASLLSDPNTFNRMHWQSTLIERQ